MPRPELPDRRDVERWLREHVRKPKPGRIARWLGEPLEYRYCLGRIVARQDAFFRRHVLFTVSGEGGLLPFVALPSGSFGLFAFDGEQLRLLSPSDDSLERLLRSEGRALEHDTAPCLAQLLADVTLYKRAHRHVVVDDAEALRRFVGAHDGFGGNYDIDETELARLANRIEKPSITGTPREGWTLRFTSIHGWMHDLQHLGVEELHLTGDFAIRALPRVTLSSKIFRRVPMVRY